MAARLCPGYFSNEVIDILRKDADGIAFLVQPCAKCGTKVTARNKAGKWIPDSHYAPTARRSYKGSGHKRSGKT